MGIHVLGKSSVHTEMGPRGSQFIRDISSSHCNWPKWLSICYLVLTLCGLTDGKSLSGLLILSPLIRLYLNIHGIIYIQQKPNVQIIVAITTWLIKIRVKCLTDLIYRNKIILMDNFQSYISTSTSECWKSSAGYFYFSSFDMSCPIKHLHGFHCFVLL